MGTGDKFQRGGFKVVADLGGSDHSNESQDEPPPPGLEGLLLF